MNSEQRPNSKHQEDEKDDNFYDCRDTLEDTHKDTHEDTVEDTHEDTVEGTHEDNKQPTQRHTVDSETDSETDRLHQEQDDRLQVEFDDEYLKELEQEVTDEERQRRRQDSLQLKDKGNGHFKLQDYAAADVTYTEALLLCPVCFHGDRSVLFSNRAAARMHLDQKEAAILDCTKALELNPDYVKARLRRAELHQHTDKLDEALDDYRKVLEQDPDHTAARLACMRLPQQIQERNEKLKEEMLGKLKDLGNSLLRPFGLSTNNFQMNQEQSGSYSINFVQKPGNT